MNWKKGSDLVVNRKNIKIDTLRKTLKNMLCNQSGQSIKAEFFWEFCIVPMNRGPFEIEKDIVLCNNEDSKLNLILHAKFDDQTRLFLMKQPVYLKEVFNSKELVERGQGEFWLSFNNVIATDAVQMKMNFKVHKAFNALFTGYIKEFEINNNMNIPVVISGVIKDYIKIGYAIFFCRGFKNPLYGTDIYHRYQNDNLIYDSA